MAERRSDVRSREGLARELQEHLRTLGVEYHVRTLKRQPMHGYAISRWLGMRCEGNCRTS